MLSNELKYLIHHKRFFSLRTLIKEKHPSEIAHLFNELTTQEQGVTFRLLPRQLASSTFEYLNIHIQKNLLKALGNEKVAGILNEMSPDDRTALFEELPSEVVESLLNLLSDREKKIATSLLGYPEDSIGRLMVPNYIRVKATWTVAKVLDHIRSYGKKIESIVDIYVIDDNGQLIGTIKIRNILVADLKIYARDLMDHSLISLSAYDDREEAVHIFKQYDKTSLPVVDSLGNLIGMVTVDDIIHVAVEEDTEDIQKFGGLNALDYPYISTPIISLVKKRAGWLIILFLSEMLTASAMIHYESYINKYVVLALFIPLIISSGGNSGSQAATLIIRALALGEIKPKDWWRVINKELISGVLLGIVLGIIGFTRVTIWSLVKPDIYGQNWILVAITIGLSLIGIVTWGVISGSMIPIILKKFNLDPATCSAPFVATLIDVTGIVIYFSVAILIMP
ncbi:MAG: magnesium transporter [Solitalea-like symbiont of Tyrophagus putrescentiae]